MSAQVKMNTLMTESVIDYRIRKLGINTDGTLQLDYFLGRQIAVLENKSRPVLDALEKFRREFLLAHMFLGFVLVIILFVPRRLLHLRSSLKVALKTLTKRTMDLFGSLLGIAASSGILFWLPLLIRLDSKGKAIYQQTRIGQNRRNGDRRKISLDVPFERRNGERRTKNLMGRPFQVYKFRSMQENAEQKTGPTWAKQDDPRITRVGRIMRPAHLDEIPQFFNVLKGDMSLVGPRPERPEFILKLNKAIPEYKKRLTCKPGITGLAQINHHYDCDLQDVIKKLDYDLHYIRHGNMFVDLAILFNTVKMVLHPPTEEIVDASEVQSSPKTDTRIISGSLK